MRDLTNSIAGANQPRRSKVLAAAAVIILLEAEPSGSLGTWI